MVVAVAAQGGKSYSRGTLCGLLGGEAWRDEGDWAYLKLVNEETSRWQRLDRARLFGLVCAAAVSPGAPFFFFFLFLSGPQRLGTWDTNNQKDNAMLPTLA